jgi:tetratricopeptide (TPR) repeat protein
MKPGATQQYYPLVHSVFWLEEKVWRDALAGYHGLNILLHAFSALLLVKILRQLKVPGAWLAAALFALHPVEVESVAWISELKNTLSGAFYLGAALFYLRFDQNRNGKNYVFALGLFLLGLMSKTVIASLPGALLVIFWWQRGKLSWRRDVLLLLPFFIAGIGAGLFTAWMERKFIGAEGSEFNFSVIERFLIAGRAVWFYLGKLFWPVDLAFIYPRWDVSQVIWWQYLFPGAALLLLGVLIWRRWRGPLAALLFFGGTLFPALGFFNVYPFRFSFVADHFQYLASLGPLTLGAAGIATMRGFFRKDKQFFKPILCAALLVVLGILTWRQCWMYANAETLWQTTLRLNPDCWMAHYNLGLNYLQQGRMDESIAHYQQAVNLKPNDAQAHNNLGLGLFQLGRLDEAITHFQKAVDLKPDYTEAHSNLGGALLQKGKADEAVIQFQRALQINPNYAGTRYNLGLSFFLLGRMGEAIAQYQKALEIQPNYTDAQKNLAWVLATCPQASLRNGQKAIELAEQASQLTGGGNPLILRILAAAFAETGRFSEAMETAQRALRLAGSNTVLAGVLQSELKLYQTGLPFHSPEQIH